MHSSCRVNSERARLGTLHGLYVQLEHRCEFWPESHAHSVVVEVQNWDLVPLLHQHFELIIELNADQDGVDIDASTGTCTC